MPAARTIFTVFEEITPATIPGSTTDVIAQDVWVEELHLMNVGSSTVTVTITDKQGSPIPLLKDIPIDPGTEFHRRYGALYMPSGIAWSASSGSAIAARLRYKY